MLEEIIAALALPEQLAEIQRVQTAHRLKLITTWEIEKGARVLEIGCGQGDMTLALGATVGKEGLVHGIDIAEESYGSPVTLGEMREKILSSAFGSQIKMDFSTNLLSRDFSPIVKYDYIVFSHCSWYFESEAQLLQTLSKLRELGKVLCFAEWDTRISLLAQMPHYQAVMTQAYCGTLIDTQQLNVRTLINRETILRLLAEAGWETVKEDIIFSKDLQDGVWELGATLYEIPKILSENSLPAKSEAFLLGQIADLKAYSKRKVVPLNVLVLKAR